MYKKCNYAQFDCAFNNTQFKVIAGNFNIKKQTLSFHTFYFSYLEKRTIVIDTILHT